jgi:hypothetical protein
LTTFIWLREVFSVLFQNSRVILAAIRGNMRIGVHGHLLRYIGINQDIMDKAIDAFSIEGSIMKVLVHVYGCEDCGVLLPFRNPLKNRISCIAQFARQIK